MSANPVILFDGVCNLCNASVTFAIDRDPGARLRFAALQSPAGRSLLESHGLPADYTGSLVLIEGGAAYPESEGALRIARHLTFPWPMFYGLRVVPRPVRDAVYRLVARHRYRWFGRSAVCRVPSGVTRHRFL
jgi:predicted DCC family thiol-disulfide oxidoreductase YuxK